MDWSTVDELVAQVQRLWDNGQLLASEGASFPLALKVRRPDRRAMSDQFDAVRRWIRSLEDGSKSARGFGYEIEWTEIEHRQLGRNRIPDRVIVPTLDDALRIIGKQKQARRFHELAELTRASFPELGPWLEKKPLTLLENAPDWTKILAVIGWFQSHPRPGIYIRQIDIPEIDTKFIEVRTSLLSTLLDLVLPTEVVDTAVKPFEARYGLLSKPPLVRFRMLDRKHWIQTLSDITVPAEQFAKWDLKVARVFITENEINGLAFPDVPDAVILFGLGYSVERLANASWLRDRPLFYWGDIDTHGFSILNRLRSTFPDTRSFLMDHETLMAHRPFWVQETDRHPGPLTRLTSEEQAVFESLITDRLGDRVRLEQERIGFGHVTGVLASLDLQATSKP